VRRRDDHLLGSGMVWEENTRNSYLLSVQRGNVSCHPVFWLLETLTGLGV
jgi:hypothetical protein